jgi:Leucine-rich repeat (LRR) protein
LTVIPESALIGVNPPAITSLILDFNAFSVLPNLGERFPALTELSLASNCLESISPKAFAFKGLTTLVLGGNLLSCDDQLNTALQQLTSLTDLNLASNRLSRIPPAVRELARLRLLSLAQNDIKTLVTAEGKSGSSSAAGNPSTSSFLLPPSLERLDLSSNALAELGAEFGPFPKLVRLDVGENQLTHLPSALASLPVLAHLSVGCNRLSALPDTTSPSASASASNSDCWPLLERLDLSANAFAAIPEALKQMKQLKSVDLSSNPVCAGDRKIPSIPHPSSVRTDYPLPDLIVPRLYLGCYQCARNLSGLQSLGVSHVLTVAHYKPLYPDRLTYKVIAVDDKDIEDLYQHMDGAVQFIKTALESNPKNVVFVHVSGKETAPVLFLVLIVWCLCEAVPARRVAQCDDGHCVCDGNAQTEI